MNPKENGVSPFGLRMSSQVRSRLDFEAKKNGRSLNAEILSRLERSFTQSSREANARQAVEDILESILESFQLPRKVIRLITGSTGSDLKILKLICEYMPVRQVSFYAVKSNQNHAHLISVINTQSHILIMDRSSLSLARQPRINEIIELFQHLDMHGVLDGAMFYDTLIDGSYWTGNGSPNEMVAFLEGVQQHHCSFQDFLNVLSGTTLLNAESFRCS